MVRMEFDISTQGDHSGLGARVQTMKRVGVAGSKETALRMIGMKNGEHSSVPFDSD